MGSKFPQESVLASKLDTLIRLQARIATEGMATQKERILFLSGAGLTPKDVGDILGVSANSVSVTLVQARKAPKGAKGRKRKLAVEAVDA